MLERLVPNSRKRHLDLSCGLAGHQSTGCGPITTCLLDIPHACVGRTMDCCTDPLMAFVTPEKQTPQEEFLPEVRTVLIGIYQDAAATDRATFHRQVPTGRT